MALTEEQHQVLSGKYFSEIERLMRDTGNQVELHLDVNTVIAIIPQLQLALRHPGNAGQTADHARAFIDGFIKSIEGRYPALAAIFRLGNDPNYDVPAEVLQ